MGREELIGFPDSHIKDFAYVLSLVRYSKSLLVVSFTSAYITLYVYV